MVLVHIHQPRLLQLRTQCLNTNALDLTDQPADTGRLDTQPDGALAYALLVASQRPFHLAIRAASRDIKYRQDDTTTSSYPIKHLFLFFSNNLNTNININININTTE